MYKGDVIKNLHEQKQHSRLILDEIISLSNNHADINISKALKEIRPKTDFHRGYLKLVLSTLELRETITQRYYSCAKSSLVENFGILHKILIAIDSLKWNDSDISLTEAVTTSEENWYLLP